MDRRYRVARRISSHIIKTMSRTVLFYLPDDVALYGEDIYEETARVGTIIGDKDKNTVQIEYSNAVGMTFYADVDKKFTVPARMRSRSAQF